jgi:isopenicillin-N epimerase
MNARHKRRTDADEDWQDVVHQWALREDTTYLNHGSFGPPPRAVQEARLDWIRRLDSQPMDFFVRQLEPALLDARSRLAEFVGTSAQNLVFVDNATYAMNVVASSFSLKSGDQVLINNHEYGAVRRIWQRACHEAEAELIEVSLPSRFISHEQITDAIQKHFSDRTKLLIISHITSPTAVIVPVSQICRLARQQDIAVCVDGPHALAQLDVRIDQLDCDFYTASCHKWLSAPVGSGFLAVHPRRQATVRPPLLSWGRLLPNVPVGWQDEFTWMGTRDPSSVLSVPAAIDFMAKVGFEEFRQRTHYLARGARLKLEDEFGVSANVPDDPAWFGSMITIPLQAGDWSRLQADLWNRCRIEVPIVHFGGHWFIRVSCHLYNSLSDIDKLIRGIKQFRPA